MLTSMGTRRIATLFNEKMSGHCQTDRPRESEDKMPLSELMDRWYVEDDPSSGATDFGYTDVASDGPSEVQSCTARSRSTGCISEDGLASCDLSPDEPSEKKISLPGIEPYTRLIRESAGYNNLLASLRREYLLSPSHPNTMETIRKTILASLPLSPLISRRQCTESFLMTYSLPVDFVTFHLQQGYTAKVEDALENVICLTGSAKYSQALTCREYVLQTWPSIGGSLLELIKTSLSCDESRLSRNGRF